MTTPTEDEIDDLLYLARVNEVADFTQFLSELSTKYSSPHLAILLSAVDPDSDNTALHYAAANGHVNVLRAVKDLTSTGTAAPSLGDGNNSANDVSADAALTDGAAIDPQLSRLANAQNAAGNTPLHWAALNGHLEVAKALVEGWGADPGVRNQPGRGALEEAEAAGRVEVREWLGVVMGLWEGDGEDAEGEEADGMDEEGGVSVNGESSTTADAQPRPANGQSEKDIAANLEQVQKRIEELQTQDQKGKEKA